MIGEPAQITFSSLSMSSRLFYLEGVFDARNFVRMPPADGFGGKKTCPALILLIYGSSSDVIES